MSWREKILRALRTEAVAMPSKWGDTPITHLAHEIQTLSGELNEQERTLIIATFVDLIGTPDEYVLRRYPDEYWADISFLLLCLPGNEKRDLQMPIFSRLFVDTAGRRTRNAVGTHLTTTCLVHAFIAVGGKFTAPQLNALCEVREHAPIAWLSAAAWSNLFKIARLNTIELLRCGKVDVGVFVLGLDDWAALWPSDQNFLTVVRQFHEVVSDAQEREHFTKWLAKES